MKLTWTQIIRQAKANRNMRVDKSDVPHPSKAGFRMDYGLPMGQMQDWRMTLQDDRCAHVREFSDHYRIHIDEVDPQVSVVGHLFADCPALATLGCVAIGVAVGSLVDRVLR